MTSEKHFQSDRYTRMTFYLQIPHPLNTNRHRPKTLLNLPEQPVRTIEVNNMAEAFEASVKMTAFITSRVNEG